jgi:hypothetical protein
VPVAPDNVSTKEIRMRSNFKSPILLISLICASVLGCPSGQQPAPFQPLMTTLDPTVVTLARLNSWAREPENSCDDWLSPWPTPQSWWNSLRLNQPPNAVAQAVVGFEIQFDTIEGGSCKKMRQDLYRAGFTYDLSQQQNLKGLVTKAELSFAAFILPAGVSSTGLCQPMSGGAGSLVRLSPGQTMPNAVNRFADLGSGPTAPFPTTGVVFPLTFPWVSGPLTTGVQTGVTVSTQAMGGNRAGYVVDVLPLIDGALNRGDPDVTFMLSGSDEVTPSVFPAGPMDSKTIYKIGSLVITHL